MASWHEKDCRRPDVVLMDSTPTCLSCGSLFLESDDEAQEQLSKQTAVVDKATARLKLDWPSSITFSSPGDVTDPDLVGILSELDRYAEVGDLDAASETTPSEYKALMEEHNATRPGVEQVGAEPLTGEAPKEDCGAQMSSLDATSTHVTPHRSGQHDVYHSLIGTDEVRLLHLDSYDTVSQPLHGILRPTRLSQRPEYVALSYTWADQNGDRTLSDKIFLGNGWTPFSITNNCAAALRRIRSRGGIRVVWIDAICIDQTNTGERSHQVSMMRDIYSRAESVTIYLGGDTGLDINTPAGRLMRRLSDERFRAGKAVTNNWGGDFDYHGICDLFGQPYWSRIWVIQEVLLARKGDIILGNASVALHEFIENFMRQLPPSIASLLPLWIYSLGGSRSGDVDAFSYLLDKTSTCKASDERDMVFALFGLLQGASLEGLVADYSKTMAEIYIGLAAYFLMRHGQSGLLKAAANTTASANTAAMYRIQRSRIEKSRNPTFRLARSMVSGLNIQRSQRGDHLDYIWHGELPSWIPFASSLNTLEVELFQGRAPPSLDDWYRFLATVDKRAGPNECYRLTGVEPTDYEPSQIPLNTYKVFRNHGTLLIRALPVVHISYMSSGLLHGAFTSTTKTIYDSNICVLTATETSMRWEICVHTSAFLARDDDWIIEVPGCNSFLHLRPSGRVPGTYKIASLSSVLLVRNYHTQPNQESDEFLDLLKLANLSMADHPSQSEIDLAKSTGQYRQVLEDALSRSADAIEDYKLWMPLISFELQHLLFLRQWEVITQMDRMVSPHQAGPDDSAAELSPDTLEKYEQWLSLKPTPDSGHGLQYNDFDSVVETVSLYLERWNDQHLWTRIHDIVVEVPWQAMLHELADIKADVWQYLASMERSKAGYGETSEPARWEDRLQELFDDLISRIPDMSRQDTEGVPSLGSFMSKNTFSSLHNSVRNIPDSWSLDKIQAKEAKIFKDWTRVESCWEFMERSKADCHALRGKFVQLRAVKRLCRREYQDFLIC